MSIVIISCDTTQVLYITRYCVYIYKDMTRHGATIRHIRKKLFSEKEKGKRKNYDQCSHITQNFPRPFLNQPNLKPYTGFKVRLFYSLGYHIWTNFKEVILRLEKKGIQIMEKLEQVNLVQVKLSLKLIESLIMLEEVSVQQGLKNMTLKIVNFLLY